MIPMILGLLTSLAGAEALPPAQVVALEAIQPQIAIDDDGAIYAVFIQRGNISVSVSRGKPAPNGGLKFDEPVVAIDAGGRAKGGLQRGPRIGVDRKKTIYVTAPVVYDESEFKKRYPTSDLYVAMSTDGGKTWGRPARINEEPKKAPEALHWLAVSPNGEAHVAWLDIRARPKGGQDVYYAKVAGGKVGKNVLAASNVCECCATGLAVDGSGRALLAWREGGAKPSREIFAAYSSADGKFGKAVKLNQLPSNWGSCPMSAPVVAVSQDAKRFAAAWMDKRTGRDDLNVYWSIAGGPEFTGDEVVGEDTKGIQNHPSLAIDPSGTVWIAWEDNRSGRETVWARSSAKGSRAKRVSEDGEGAAAFPTLAANAGVVGLAYEVKHEGEERVVFRLIQNMDS